MLNAKWFLQNKQSFEVSFKQRGFAFDFFILEKLENERLDLITTSETLQAKRNKIAKEIGVIKAQKQDATTLLEESNYIKETLPQLLEERNKTEEEIHQILSTLPNILEESVPEGVTEEHNIEIKQWGVPRTFNFTPKAHNDLGVNLKQMDFKTASTLSGSRFVYLKGDIARLERALKNFMLEHNAENGYEEISPPFLTNAEAFFNTGQLPKFEGDFFKTTDGRYLIPTSEVPLTNIVAGEILQEHELPLRFTACTPCFRSEAGSSGKDTIGMIRQHQFLKVELVTIASEDASIQEHEKMLLTAENILQKLKLPYRVVTLCSGDISATAQKTYDIEVWLPSQNKYREISSISNTGSFQARRMMARYKKAGQKETTFLHTLNGSSLAIGRTIVAILENYQNEDGTITIPEVLQNLMGKKIIKYI
ncbi:MAG: seryl-tRNA synthetase [Candidatus Deianiraeaceae bacterium]|jgi:seryl-tRNA synthetase